MSSITAGPNYPQWVPFSHQVDFIDKVVNKQGKCFFYLRGDVGSGKTFALIALANRFLQIQPGARVLILCPAALRQQFIKMLHEGRTPAILVDRYKFREMLDNSNTAELWPSGVAIVMSYDFAKQLDIRDSLASTHWDLMIIDEAHMLGGARKDLFQLIEPVTERTVLATLTSLQVDVPQIQEAEKIIWHRDGLIAPDGKPLYGELKPLMQEIFFTLNQEEKAISMIVDAMCLKLEAGAEQQRFFAKILRRSLHSSPASLESTLRRAALSAEIRDEENELMGNEFLTEKYMPNDLQRATDEIVKTYGEQALEKLETLHLDSKLNALRNFLENLQDFKRTNRLIFVITDFISTLNYLIAALEEIGHSCLKLYGEMSFAARHELLRKFIETGDILITTRGMMTEGLDLKEVTDLVLYDLPQSKISTQMVLGSFDRFGRTKQLNVYAFAESESTDSNFLESLHLLKEMVQK